MSDLETIILGNGKPWTEMNRKEKLAAYDEISKVLRELEEHLRNEFDQMLIAGGSTMRTTVKIMLDIDPNDDPRLP